MDTPIDYMNFIGTVKDRIRNAQYSALRAVNKELVGLYWDIGRMISEKQKELGWGKSVIEQIAIDLKREFPNNRGFSSRNLWLMVSYYAEYKEDIILQSLTAEISFTHNVTIFTKCKIRDQRLFYIKMANEFGWSSRVLEHQIEINTYEKYLLGQTSINQLLVNKSSDEKITGIKDHYTFDFLNLSTDHSERDLESALIQNIPLFLLELGGEFAFLGSQYKITVGSQDFYIDLLLYHRRIQCLVVIELKSGAFKPEYKGKLEFYLNVLNDTKRLPHENESIGIIICRTKDRLIVEYSLMKTQNFIGIASYSTGPELPEYYKNALPTAEQIERGLSRITSDYKSELKYNP